MGSPLSGSTQQPTRPNILLITADDLGLQVGCYGDTVARTPNLNRLATKGLRLANAYVTQASCSPSRSSILTGLYPHQSGQVGLAHMGFAVHDTVVTLPALLKERGYRTGIIGKLHVQPEKSFPFDYELYKHTARNTRDVRTVADSATAFIERTEDTPFFLMVNYFDPHAKFIPQVEDIPKHPYRSEEVKPLPFQQLDTPGQRERIANFYSCIARLDTGLGMLMEALEATGQAENTLVIYLGDHGAPFTRGKTSCYEAGLKIPFLVRWPGYITPNSVDSALISTIDILPTILEATQASVPEYLPGRSLLPIFNQEQSDWRTHLYSEFFYHSPTTYFPRYSVRNQRYKLILNLSEEPNPILSIDGDQAYQMSQQPEFNGTLAEELFQRYAQPPQYELYDLNTDPNELYNLAYQATYTEKRNALQAQLQQWILRTQAP